MTLHAVEVTTREQLEACFSIRMKVFVDEQKVPQEEELDEYDESPDACRHWLILDGDKPVGTGRWKVFEPGVAKLQRIAVIADVRSRGVGRIILEALEADAKHAGMDQALLDGQCTAEGFYAKLGYRVISEEPFLDAGIWHLRMVKKLI